MDVIYESLGASRGQLSRNAVPVALEQKQVLEA
jgi:hypothetical protein